jgi:hypothetical protein
MLGVTGPFNCLSTNSYGDFVFAVSGGDSSLNIFYPTHTDKALLVPSAGNTYTALSNYNSGNNVIISQNTFESIVNGAVVFYSVVNKYPPGEPSAPCFNEGTKILTDTGYKLIEELKNGDLVKTFNDGYKPIIMIGKKEIIHQSRSDRIADQLYKCSSTEFPEIFEPLIITGCHSILVSEFKNNERKKTEELLGDIYVTDKKYRLPACIDERTKVYDIPGKYTIYHFALEHDNYYMNYGVYANGLLVETCSKRYLKELSGMTLIE